MGYFRQNDVRMWGDDKFRRLSAPRPCGRYLWLYLLNGPHTSIIPGLSSVGEMALAEALDWPLKAFREAFAEVSQQGMAKADWTNRILWLPKGIKYNLPASPNVVKSWHKTWDAMPECPLLESAWDGILAALQNREAFAKAFREACKRPTISPFAEQKQQQEQEQEQEHKLREKAPSPEALWFDSFWGLYPRKESKSKARVAWDKISPDGELWQLMQAALGWQTKSRQWTDEGGKYIPHPATWLNNHRWEDQPIKAADKANKFAWAEEFMASEHTEPVTVEVVGVAP
jgi:hypothetical protein